jgi:predicted transcriptional regulator
MARFTYNELLIMHILWKHGEQKPAEIQERFPREIKNAATRSFLRVLLNKGHVTRRKVGKAYYYKAKTSPERALRTLMQTVVDTFFDGSREALLAKLIREMKLSEKDLLKIKRKADEAKKGSRKK